MAGDDAPRRAYGDVGPASAPTSRCPAMASNAHRSDMSPAMAWPAEVMTGTGTMAPEKSTAGKHSIGSASAACAVDVTEAEASKPRHRAATALSAMVVNIAAHTP